MSTEARREAISAIENELDELDRSLVPVPNDEKAGMIVDKLLETHAISRRAPRAHRAVRIQHFDEAGREVSALDVLRRSGEPT